jgi:hypothetical protein
MLSVQKGETGRTRDVSPNETLGHFLNGLLVYRERHFKSYKVEAEQNQPAIRCF